MKRTPYEIEYEVGDFVKTHDGMAGTVICRYPVKEEVQIRFVNDEVLVFDQYGKDHNGITQLQPDEDEK